MLVIAVVILFLLVLVFCFRFVLLCFVLFCFFLFYFIFFRFALRPTIVVCLYLMYTIRARGGWGGDGRARGTARLKTDRV